MPTPDSSFDNVALLAIDDALRSANPNVKATLLASCDAKLFALQSQMLDRSADTGGQLAAVQGLLPQSQATRLILVLKNRSE